MSVHATLRIMIPIIMPLVFFKVISCLWESRMRWREENQLKPLLRVENQQPVSKFEDLEYLAWYVCCFTWKRFLHYNRWFPDPGRWHHIILWCIPIFWYCFNLEDLHETLQRTFYDSPQLFDVFVELPESKLDSITRLLVILIEFYIFSCW